MKDFLLGFLFCFILFGLLYFLLFKFWKKISKNFKRFFARFRDDSKDIQFYRRKYLLTKNEYNFYLKLKPVADKLGLSIISKVRMADLVEPSYPRSDKKYYRLFARIKSKHVDFALCSPNNLYVKLLIELDDTSHQRQDRIDRDAFVEAVYAHTGYNLLRLYSDDDIEKLVTEALAYTNNVLQQKTDPVTEEPPVTGS